MKHIMKQTELTIITLEKEYADLLLNETLKLHLPSGMGRRNIAQYGKDYTYSGKTYTGRELPDWLVELLRKVNTLLGTDFNSILINKYQKGVNTGIGSHSDDEPELGLDPLVASLSLGYSDTFYLTGVDSCSILLEHGDLLLMGKGCQKHYRHHIPYKVMPNTRISLTFRKFHE